MLCESTMKPKVFIASSTESLPTAYVVQENLEHDVECTVWTQGGFNLSESSLDSLVEMLNRFDFGIFVVEPNDVMKMPKRDQEFSTARDNVIFELGLFIGKLGKSRNFILTPRGEKNFHLPTDLLGLTPATFPTDRSDGISAGALGPACNKIRQSIKRLGPIDQTSTGAVQPQPEEVDYDDKDVINLITNFIKSKQNRYDDIIINYHDVDKEYGFAAGTTAEFIEAAVEQGGIYNMGNKGKSTAFLRYRTY